MDDTNISARIKRAADELERRCIHLGMVVITQHVIDAGVKIARDLEKLDAIEPVNNSEYRRLNSVRMEAVQAAYMAEEENARAEISAARALLDRLVFRANGADE